MPPRIDVHYIPITLARRKKHRLHLTDGVRDRRIRLALLRRRRAPTSRAAPARMTGARGDASFSTLQEPRWNRCFRAYREFNRGFARAMRIASDEGGLRRKPRALCRFYPGQKFFPQTHPLRRCAAGDSTKNERIERKVIRFATFARCRACIATDRRGVF